ncbi:hypothetical protein [Alteromonas sp. 14N.309.X.WAT.G.H12]|uniref:hypothetical protein n=1 Tax=Alteromonas sp. 14N.309.X.WAT.G.H12 TaxID=3120824 RepID=UPI002FD14579
MKFFIGVALLAFFFIFGYLIYSESKIPKNNSYQIDDMAINEFKTLPEEQMTLAANEEVIPPNKTSNRLFDDLSHQDKINAFYRGYRGISTHPDENRYANETNLEFMFDMARSGDFNAQDKLIFLLNPSVISSLKGAYENTEDPTIGNKLEYYRNIYTLS